MSSKNEDNEGKQVAMSLPWTERHKWNSGTKCVYETPGERVDNHVSHPRLNHCSKYIRGTCIHRSQKEYRMSLILIVTSQGTNDRMEGI